MVFLPRASLLAVYHHPRVCSHTKADLNPPPVRHAAPAFPSAYRPAVIVARLRSCDHAMYDRSGFVGSGPLVILADLVLRIGPQPSFVQRVALFWFVTAVTCAGVCWTATTPIDVSSVVLGKAHRHHGEVARPAALMSLSCKRLVSAYQEDVTPNLSPDHALVWLRSKPQRELSAARLAHPNSGVTALKTLSCAALRAGGGRIPAQETLGRHQQGVRGV